MMTPKRIEQTFLIFEKNNPKPTTELNYKSVFELLIAVILSAQATDVSVNKVTGPLFRLANTPETIYELGLEKLSNHIRSIGLFNSKAKNILATCQMLIELHDSKVPTDRIYLEALPGVGRKTANVILNTYFKQPVIAVDTHILRVANRMKLSDGTTPLQVERDLEKKIPKKYLLNAHHWLILHGRYTCKARKPLCTTCSVEKYCLFQNKKKA